MFILYLYSLVLILKHNLYISSLWLQYELCIQIARLVRQSYCLVQFTGGFNKHLNWTRRDAVCCWAKLAIETMESST